MFTTDQARLIFRRTFDASVDKDTVGDFRAKTSNSPITLGVNPAIKFMHIFYGRGNRILLGPGADTVAGSHVDNIKLILVLGDQVQVHV